MQYANSEKTKYEAFVDKHVPFKLHGECIDHDMQWIFCAETYNFLSEMVIKELCILCIQTGDYFTFHVCPDLLTPIRVDLHNSLNQALYKSQYAKHLLDWDEGEFDVDEMFFIIVHNFLDAHNPIFVVDKALKNLLHKQGFTNVTMLSCAPLHTLNAAPAMTCKKYGHLTTFEHCAQRKCHELYEHLRPKLQPYYNPNAFEYKNGKFNDISPLSHHINHIVNDLDECKYAELISIIQDGSGCGKRGLEWKHDESSGSITITTVVQRIGECTLGETSSGAADAVDN